MGKDWGICFQDECSPIMVGIRDLHEHIMYYLIMIIVLVGYIIMREIISKRPVIKYLNHSVLIELIWTITPGLILLLIGIPSLKLLYMMDEVLKPQITLKATGYQWYWQYQLKDSNLNIEFDSYTKSDTDLSLGEFRLLDVDNQIILPVNHTIRVLVTSEDVMHSWAIPGLGVKIDAIPGRINQTYFHLLREGILYGQCSELCGISHHSMSIVLNSVSNKEYLAYLISNYNISLNNLLNISKTLKDLIK